MALNEFGKVVVGEVGGLRRMVGVADQLVGPAAVAVVIVSDVLGRVEVVGDVYEFVGLVIGVSQVDRGVSGIDRICPDRGQAITHSVIGVGHRTVDPAGAVLDRGQAIQGIVAIGRLLHDPAVGAVDLVLLHAVVVGIVDVVEARNQLAAGRTIDDVGRAAGVVIGVIGLRTVGERGAA